MARTSEQDNACDRDHLRVAAVQMKFARTIDGYLSTTVDVRESLQ
jgi:hypothetical protein